MERLIFSKQFHAPMREAEGTSYTYIFSFAFLSVVEKSTKNNCNDTETSYL